MFRELRVVGSRFLNCQAPFVREDIMCSLKNAGVMSSMLILAACGGDGGVASIPVPPVAPSPAYTSFDKPTATVFNALGAQVDFVRYRDASFTIKGAASQILSAESTAMTIDYQPETNTYIVSDGSHSASFSSLPYSPSRDYDSDWKEYPSSITNQSNVDSIEVGNNSKIVYSYVNIVNWFNVRRGTINPNPDSGYADYNRAIYGVIGYETLPSDMPRAGQGRYAMTATGIYIAPGVISEPGRIGTAALLQAAISFSADFAAGTVKTTIFLNRNNMPNPDVIGAGTIGAGTNKFSGSLASSDQSLTGSFTGAFFGPQAKEMGMGFNITDSTGVMAGVAIGKR